MFEDLKYMYNHKYKAVDFNFVCRCVLKSWITSEEFFQITGKKFSYTFL